MHLEWSTHSPGMEYAFTWNGVCVHIAEDTHLSTIPHQLHPVNCTLINYVQVWRRLIILLHYNPEQWHMTRAVRHTLLLAL